MSWYKNFLLILFAIGANQSYADQLKFEILGLTPELTQTIINDLTIHRLEDNSNLSAESINGMYQLTTQEITETLNALGYYAATITPKLEDLEANWHASFTIHLGSPVLINNINISILGEAINEPLLLNAKKDYLAHLNKVFVHKEYINLKDNLLNSARELGYLDALFIESDIFVNREKFTASININLDTGKRFQFGEITFNDTDYPTQFLKKYVPFTKGMPYTSEKVSELHKNLLDTHLFSKIRVIPKPSEGEQYEVPISVKLVTRPKNKYSAGLGFGTDTGFRISGGWERKRLSFPGHKISTDLKLSKSFQRAQLRYIVPGPNPLNEITTFGVQTNKYIKYDNDKKTKLKTDLKSGLVINNIKKIGFWERTLSVSYFDDVFKYGLMPKRHVKNLFPGLGVSWIKSEKDNFYVQKGFNAHLNIKAGFKGVLSSTNIAQTTFGVKGVMLLGKSDLRLLARSDIGATFAKNYDLIPPTMRYSTGGDNTVRGYKFEDIGPKHLEGDEIINDGGRYQWVNSIEIDKTITPPLKIAVFLDGGNAMLRWTSKLKYGAGIGVRWATPVGPLKIDLAKALEPNARKDKLNRKNFRVHVTFGWEI